MNPIDMNQISWNVKTWNWILKHMTMICQDLPVLVLLADTITGFASMNSSKLEWFVDESILMKHMNVLLGDHQVILNGVCFRWSRRLN
jgi:hypothetical protein